MSLSRCTFRLTPSFVKIIPTVWTSISNKLTDYDLETNWDVIKRMSPNEWKEKVRIAVLRKNGQKLIENCTSINGQEVKIHTKTKHIHEKLTNNRYKGTPSESLIQGNKQKTRTIFLAQNGMLECGRNFKGTIPEICPDCNETDDEQHRLSVVPGLFPLILLSDV